MAQETSDLLEQLKFFIVKPNWPSSTFKMAAVLPSSECVLLNPDFLVLDIHAFPHFSGGAVCFGDPTEVERGDTGQGAQHILPVGKTRAGGQPPPPTGTPLPCHQLLLPPLTAGMEGLEYSLGETEFILTAGNN